MKKEKEQSTGKAQYWIAGLILLMGVAVSGLILVRSGVIGGKAPAEGGKPSAQSAVEQEKRFHTVRFLNVDGSLIREETVPYGEPVLPPEVQQDNAVQTGWDGELFHIVEDMEVTPTFQPLDTVKNAVYMNCVYQPVEDEIVMTITLGGQVDCCGFELEAAYDKELLKLLEAEPLLEGLQTEHKTKNGLLELILPDGEDLRAETELVRLHFKCTKQDSYSTTIPVLTREIHKRGEAGIGNTDSTAYDGRLYLMEKK